MFTKQWNMSCCFHLNTMVNKQSANTKCNEAKQENKVVITESYNLEKYNSVQRLYFTDCRHAIAKNRIVHPAFGNTKEHHTVRKHTRFRRCGLQVASFPPLHTSHKPFSFPVFSLRNVHSSFLSWLPC